MRGCIYARACVCVQNSYSFLPLICIYELGIIGTLLFMNPPPLIHRDLIEMNYINYINYILLGKLNLN